MMIRRLCGLTVLVLFCCAGSSSNSTVPEAVWHTWMPSESRDKVNSPQQILVYIQNTLREKFDPGFKIYVEIDTTTMANFSDRRADTKTTAVQDNKNPPLLAALDSPPIMDLRSALKLCCDVLGARWRQDGNKLFITQESPSKESGTVSKLSLPKGIKCEQPKGEQGNASH